jgi:DNA-binding transcriptional LysR family regulator
MQVSDRIGRRIKLHDLHVLMSTVQAGSMSKAAALLHTTQSSVSRSIAELEQTIGVRLLDRGSQGVEPTRYGRALLNRGIAAFDELKQGIRDIEFLASPEAGELIVGAGSALAEGLILAVIARLSPRFPRVVYNIIPGSFSGLCDQLRARHVELGFSANSQLIPQDDIETEVLFEEQLVVVAAAKSPWTRRRRIDLAELVGEPWTWSPPGGVIDGLVVEAFRACGVEPPRATVYTDAVNVRMKLATNQSFLTVFPASMLTLAPKNDVLKILPVHIPTSRRQTGILRLKNRTPSPLAQLFVECAREVAKPLAKKK